LSYSNFSFLGNDIDEEILLKVVKGNFDLNLQKEIDYDQL